MSNCQRIALICLAMACFAINAHAFGNATSDEARAKAYAAAEGFTGGTVIETMNASGYTYLHLESNGEKHWVAIPAAEVTVGQQVEIAPGAEMKNFSSNSLGRTFETIIFSSGLVVKE